MPYITDLVTKEAQARAVDQGKDLALTDCDFCGREIVVPAGRLNQACFCTEICFRARYGAHCSEGG